MIRVFVYWNLHRDCYSVRALTGPDRGRVVHHAAQVEIAEATLRVSEAGRQRVLRDRRKNVHAGIVGRLAQWWPDVPPTPIIGGARVRYNPYTLATFVDAGTSEPVTGAARVVATTGADGGPVVLVFGRTANAGADRSAA